MSRRNLGLQRIALAAFNGFFLRSLAPVVLSNVDEEGTVFFFFCKSQRGWERRARGLNWTVWSQSLFIFYPTTMGNNSRDRQMGVL